MIKVLPALHPSPVAPKAPVIAQGCPLCTAVPLWGTGKGRFYRHYELESLNTHDIITSSPCSCVWLFFSLWGIWGWKKTCTFFFLWIMLKKIEFITSFIVILLPLCIVTDNHEILRCFPAWSVVSGSERLLCINLPFHHRVPFCWK